MVNREKGNCYITLDPFTWAVKPIWLQTLKEKVMTTTRQSSLQLGWNTADREWFKSPSSIHLSYNIIFHLLGYFDTFALIIVWTVLFSSYSWFPFNAKKLLLFILLSADCSFCMKGNSSILKTFQNIFSAVALYTDIQKEQSADKNPNRPINLQRMTPSLQEYWCSMRKVPGLSI